MKFTEMEIKGVFFIETEFLPDERGFFGRFFCEEEFEKRGLEFTIRQSNISFNKKKGTVRGLHFQKPPHEEAKLIMCTAGSVFDVAVDLRPGSPTYKKWVSVRLDSEKPTMFYIPKSCAHGFQTLEDNTSLLYQMFEFYDPGSAAGARHDDSRFQIRWPLPVTALSGKDRSYPNFAD